MSTKAQPGTQGESGEEEQPASPPPSPLLDHPLIPLPEFREKLRAALSVPQEELDRREAEYRQQQAAKKNGR